MLGRKKTEATKKKISASLTGRTLSPTHRENISKAQEGKARGPYNTKPKKPKG